MKFKTKILLGGEFLHRSISPILGFGTDSNLNFNTTINVLVSPTTYNIQKPDLKTVTNF